MPHKVLDDFDRIADIAVQVNSALRTLGRPSEVIPSALLALADAARFTGLSFDDFMGLTKSMADCVWSCECVGSVEPGPGWTIVSGSGSVEDPEKPIQ